MTGAATQDLAQRVAAAHVARQDAVGDHERGGPNVVCNDLEGDVSRRIRPVLKAHQLLDPSDNGANDVDVVVGELSLHDGRQPLEPHAGVDGRFRQGVQVAGGVAIILHEDEVPELQVAVALFFGAAAAGRAAPDGRALVVDELGARPAGARIAHCPEIVLLIHPDNPLVRHPDGLSPEIESFVVVAEDGNPHPFRIEAAHIHEELPTELNGLLLEVVAEGEVAQHLEECMVAGRAADGL